MRLVILESPFSGNVEVNKAYARACAVHCLQQGEAPIASHLLYTQMLDDTVPEEREMGIKAGLAWLKVAECTVVYTDLGVSKGMTQGVKAAEAAGVPIEWRRLGRCARDYLESDNLG